MAPLPVTLSDLEGYFSCMKPFQLLYLGKCNITIYDMFIRKSESVRGL